MTATATGNDLQRVHDRIDGLMKEMADLTSAVRVSNALCSDCRPKVMGNGKSGFDKRISDLETTLGVSKWFVGMAIAIAGVIGSIVGPLVSYVLKH